MEARFSAPVQTGPGAHPASCTMGTGAKQPGFVVDHLPSSNAEVKERVELYFYPLWLVLGRSLILTFTAGLALFCLCSICASCVCGSASFYLHPITTITVAMKHCRPSAATPGRPRGALDGAFSSFLGLSWIFLDDHHREADPGHCQMSLKADSHIPCRAHAVPMPCR